MSIRLAEEDAPFDPESRRLCGDPACIGVIGDDGHCKECGRIGEGEEPHARHFSEDEGQTSAGDVAAAPTETESAAPAQSEPASDAGFEDRRLCGDPGCIGVLSADGRCSECGRVFA